MAKLDMLSVRREPLAAALWPSKVPGEKNAAGRPKPGVNYLGPRTVKANPDSPKARVNANVPFYLVIFNELI